MSNVTGWKNISRCVVGRRVTICQGDTKTIKCGHKFRVLKVVTATYGRTDALTCSLSSANVATTNCGKKNNALHIVRQKCNTRHKCSIFSSNTVFKDPCIGTSVYLRVVFRCVRGKSFYENSVSLIVSLSPNPTKSTILVDNIIRILLIYIRCIFH